MISISQIKATKHYKSVDGIRKIFLTKKGIVRDIELGCNMSKLRSFEYWEIACSPRHDVKEVVRELIQ